MHIVDGNDTLLTRGEFIVDAVKNLDYEVNLCVLALTGDIANTGSDEEYFVAWDFLEKLSSSLSKAIPHKAEEVVPVHFVAVPGNHDCDFHEHYGAREILTQEVLKRPGSARDSSIVEVCTKSQRGFFQLLDAIALTGRTSHITGFDARLYWEYQFSVRDENVRFLCCNTAWLSQLNEKPGALFFPPEAVSEHARRESLVGVLLHHPPNWLEPNSSRELRKRIARVGDLVLTGHEHQSSRREILEGTGEVNDYIEGGVLQERDRPLISSFNALVIDTCAKKQKFVNYTWSGERYVPGAESTKGMEGAGLAWKPFAGNRSRIRGAFEPSEHMHQKLLDPGVTLIHRTQTAPTLPDIFVFPDLREIVFPPPESPAKIVKGIKIPELVERLRYLIIDGDDQCGKTSLAKTIFSLLHRRGAVPLFIDQPQDIPSGDRVYGYLEKIFVEQYGPSDLDQFRQLDRSKRAIIIDDYHNCKLIKRAKKDTISNMISFAGCLILFANDLSLHVDDLANPGSRENEAVHFEHFRIMPFGRVQRDELIDKWFLSDEEETEDGEGIAHQIVAMNRTLDTLIGRNYVPSYPVYILSVLQASEAVAPIDLGASTHGYFYEIFIRAALARGRTRVEYDVVSSYLAHLAYRFFVDRRVSAERSIVQIIHEEYEARHALRRAFDTMIENLVDQQILALRDGRYRFKYKYLYYFFVASYIRDHISHPDVRTQIKSMSRRLYVEEYANILLFVAHLSKDPLILSEMRAAADELLANNQAATLTEDVAFLNNLDPSGVEIVYKDEDVTVTRRQILQALDEREDRKDDAWEAQHPRPEYTEPASSIADPLIRINSSLKTLQILGQVLKNFPGSLDADEKYKTLSSCYLVGLRSLSEVLGAMRTDQLEILRTSATAVRAHHPNFDDEKVVHRAAEIVVALGRLTCFGFVKRISDSVGSPEMTETYEQLLQEIPTPAMQLIDLSLALDQFGGFPLSRIRDLVDEFSQNAIVLSVLRFLAVHYFYLFPLDFRTKQAACESLGISYPRIRGVDPDRRVLGS